MESQTECSTATVKTSNGLLSDDDRDKKHREFDSRYKKAISPEQQRGKCAHMWISYTSTFEGKIKYKNLLFGIILAVWRRLFLATKF